MLDVKRIRNEFDALSEKLATRGVVAETLNELKELDVKIGRASCRERVLRLV